MHRYDKITSNTMPNGGVCDFPRAIFSQTLRALSVPTLPALICVQYSNYAIFERIIEMYRYNYLVFQNSYTELEVANVDFGFSLCNQKHK